MVIGQNKGNADITTTTANLVFLKNITKNIPQTRFANANLQPA